MEGQTDAHSPTFAFRMSSLYWTAPVSLSMCQTFWKTVSVTPRKLPSRRSSFQRSPSFPAVRTTGRPSRSTRTCSNPWSRSRDSPGECVRYHTMRPVSGSMANVEFAYSVESTVVSPRLAATQGFA